MKKRTFTAEEKARIVLEVLRGEKELSQIATENDISSNQIRNWKNEALDKLPMLFDAKRDRKLKERITQQEQEIEQAYKKIGQLTTKVDWLEKKSEEILGSGWESRFTPHSR